MSERFLIDQDIDRRQVPALKSHSRGLGQEGADLSVIADTETGCRAPKVVLKPFANRSSINIFDYEAMPNGSAPAQNIATTRARLSAAKDNLNIAKNDHGKTTI